MTAGSVQIIFAIWFFIHCGVFRPDVCLVTMKVETVRFSETSPETKCATLRTGPKDAHHIIT